MICVPTPLSDDHKPDLALLICAITMVGKNLKSGTLVILESTIEPGTCRNIALPILLEESGLKMDEIEVAYSPERIDPANKKWGIRNTPKLVAGLTENSTKRASEFYGKFILCANGETDFIKISPEEIRFWVRRVPNFKSEIIELRNNMKKDSLSYIPDI